jgi:hypothetical protein
VTETTNKHIKNIVAQYKVERWEYKKGMETIPPPHNNLRQDSEGNEENGYPVPDSNKTKINTTKKPNNTHKNILKEEILQVITENFMEM